MCWLTVFLMIPDVHSPVFIHDLPIHKMLTYPSILPLALMRGLVRTTCKYCRMKWLLVATVGGSALGFPLSIPPQVPIQKYIDKRTTRRSARLQCSSASMVVAVTVESGWYAECLPIASGSRLVAHGSPSKSETLAASFLLTWVVLCRS